MKQNPKHIRAQEDGKVPYEFLPWELFENDAWVHKHGGDKYGLRNWRLDEILASTYVGAMMRHLSAWVRGEDIDPDSGKPHLTHLRACCAVVLDGQAYGKFIDDRLLCESKDPTDGAVRSAHVQKPVCNHLPAEDCPVHPMTVENQIPVPEDQIPVGWTQKDFEDAPDQVPVLNWQHPWNDVPAPSPALLTVAEREAGLKDADVMCSWFTPGDARRYGFVEDGCTCPGCSGGLNIAKRVRERQLANDNLPIG